MGRKIIWTQFSKEQLQQVYNYHFEAASEQVAFRLISKIVSHVDILINHPFIGKREESLAEYPQDFRYIVEGNYKIVYYADEKSVIIVSVFDSRQDPTKLRKGVLR